MEFLQDAKQLIAEAKNICVIPNEHELESLSSSLALFYTLKELGKNVNLITENLPEPLNFLVPSLDFISQPKNFVISIPKNVADISQIYYEKNEDNLKIHLTVSSGNIKKDSIAFYFSETKPDLIITLGIKDFQKELEQNLNSFGFLLDAPIINIDSEKSLPAFALNGQGNKRFGKINIVEEKSLTQIILDVAQAANPAPLAKNTAQCILAGLMLCYENFQKPNTPAEIFELCAQLMKQGGDRKQIIENLYKKSDSNLQITPEFTNTKSEFVR